MNETKMPNVAGSFYPARAEQLNNMLQGFFMAADPVETPSLNAVVVPHAGYVFSGACAAWSFKALQLHGFSRAIVLAPSHSQGYFEFCLPNYHSFTTPLGKIEIDTDTCAQLAAHPAIMRDNVPFAQEHSLEVQLPFLQYINPEFTLVPALTGSQSLESSQNMAHILAALGAEFWRDTVLVISSDLSHYHNAKKATILDGNAMELMSGMDTQAFYAALQNGGAEACGAGGILVGMELARLWQAKAKTLFYTHSGQINNDNTRVVGYGALAFYGGHIC